jgi:hypothetical protein
MELLLAGVEPGQQDRDRRARAFPRLAQPPGYLDALVGERQPLQRRIEARRACHIAPDHAIVCGPPLVRMTCKQVLAVMIINRGAHIGFGGGDRPALVRRLLRERLVARRFLRPQAAPVLPPLDAGDEPLNIVRIDAGREVTRQIVRKY